MKNIYQLRLLPLMCCLLSIGIFTACKKNDNVSTAVELLSFGPTGAKHGDTMRFIGKNLSRVTDIMFTGATVEKTGFLSQANDLILVVVPAKAEKGFVTLKTSDGDIVSKTVLNLGVTVEVTSMNAEVRPGANVTINGNYLNWVKTVTFAKGKVVATFVTQTLNQLVVKVPDDAETGPLLISYGGTDSMQVETKDTLKVTLPKAVSIAPTPVKHQTNLTITGTDLDLVKQVLFTGVSAPVTSFVSQTATQLVVTVPASTTKGKITLKAASGQSTQSPVDVEVLLPAITSVSPNPVDPQADVTIIGTNLDLVSAVVFNNAAPVTTFVSQSPTQIVAKVPVGVSTGKVTLKVLNSTLTVASAATLEITGDAPPPTIALAFYKDALSTNWNGWLGGGWGGTKDMDNTNPVREGTKSVKINYVGGYGSPLQLGGANINLAPYTTLKISVYGAPGSNGKRINIGLNNADGTTLTIVEGKWTDYSLPLGSLTGASNLTDLLIKEYSGSGGFSIYVDALGLN